MDTIKLISEINAILPRFPKSSDGIYKPESFKIEVRNYLKSVLEKLKSNELFNNVVFCRAVHWTYINSYEGEWLTASPEYFRYHPSIKNILTYYFLLHKYNTKNTSFPISFNSFIFKNIGSKHPISLITKDAKIVLTIHSEKTNNFQIKIDKLLKNKLNILVTQWKNFGDNLIKKLKINIQHSKSVFSSGEKSLEDVLFDGFESSDTDCSIYKSIEDISNSLSLDVSSIRNFFNNSIPKEPFAFVITLLYLLLQTGKNSEKRSIVFIPSGVLCKNTESTNKSVNNVEGFGGMTVIFDSSDKKTLEIIKLVTDITWSKLGVWEGELKTIWETIKHGTKAAMTAIMSRNLSHNIGSHVISYHVQTIKDDRQQERELYQYIQHRMDFLAEITTSGPTWEMSFDFKTDIMEEFYKQEILLKTICHSEGININGETFNLKIEPKCKRVSIPNGMVGKHAFYSIMENFLRNSAKHHKSDVQFSVLIEMKVPNCLSLSTQPTINGKLKDKCEWIDNSKYLRFKTENNNWDFLTDDEINSMFPKNGDDRNKLRDFCKKQRLFIELRIWDNREGSCGTTMVKDENNNKTISVVEKLRKFITGDDARLIQEDGGIKPEGWGIKEMRISASFLRKIGAEALLESKEIDLPLMDVLCGDPNSNDFLCKNGEAATSASNNCSFVNDYKKRLCFRFYLRRPKDMLVISDKVKVAEKNNFELEWSKKDTLLLDDVKTLKDEVPHRIMMVKEEDKTLFSESPFAPSRIVTYNNSSPPEINDNFYLQKYEEFIKKEIYKKNGEFPALTYQSTITAPFCLFFTAQGMQGITASVIPENINGYFKKNDEGKEWKWSYNGSVINDLKNCILFYYHANESSEQTRLKELVDNEINVQPVSGGYSTKRKLEALKDLPPLYQKYLTLELIESALTKVVIIDERVSEWTKKNIINDVKRAKILENMNLFVVDIDTNNININNIMPKLISFCLSTTPAHFFVIHQGILDKFEEEKAGSSGQFMESIKKMSRWKVVDSGRGVPTKLLEGVRFVEISALLKMIMEFDKHALVQTLFSLRRPK